MGRTCTSCCFFQFFPVLVFCFFFFVWHVPFGIITLTVCSFVGLWAVVIEKHTKLHTDAHAASTALLIFTRVSI